jgi:hypothetical protein
MESIHAVDQSVSGIDYELNLRIDRVSLRMMEAQFSMMERLKQEAQSRYRTVRMTITLMTLGILSLIGALVWKSLFSRRSRL